MLTALTDNNPILKRAKEKNCISRFPKKIILMMPCNFIRSVLTFGEQTKKRKKEKIVLQLPGGSDLHNKCSVLYCLFAGAMHTGLERQVWGRSFLAPRVTGD